MEAGNVNGIFTDLLEKIKNEENYDKDLEKFFAIDDELMAIGNLTLLIAHDNRGIGNGFFFKKDRNLKRIISKAVSFLLAV